MRLSPVAGCALIWAFASAPLGAQALRGIVTDGTSGQPIAGAVLVLLDSAGRTVGRSLSDGVGAYRLIISPVTYRLRVVRLGFRPRDLAIPIGARSFDVALQSVPSLLETVQATAAASCPRRRDREAALALREQARAGLLSSVVSHESKRAHITRLGFERFFDGRERIERQLVAIDSSQTTGSWQVAMGAREFTTMGFVIDDGDTLGVLCTGRRGPSR